MIGQTCCNTGDWDDKAKHLADIAKRKAQEEMMSALTVMLRSKLLREAYQNLATEVKARCEAAQSRAQEDYGRLADELAAKVG